MTARDAKDPLAYFCVCGARQICKECAEEHKEDVEANKNWPPAFLRREVRPKLN